MRSAVMALLAAAWLMLAAPVLAQPLNPPAPSAEELKQQGDDAMARLNFSEALDRYDRAYAIAPNPALHYNRGRALQLLDRLPEALEAFETFRREAPPDLKARVPKLDELIAEINGKVGSLDVKSTPPGASVLVAGREIGTTPFAAPVRLKAGTLVVRVRKEGFHPLERTVELQGGKVLVIDEPLQSSSRALLSVSSVPGAEVHVDGERVGTVPAEKSLDPGEHRVEVSHDDYEAAETSVTLAAGERKSIDVPLQARPEIYERWWFWTAISTVVVGGVVLTVALSVEGPADSGDIAPGQIAAPLITF